MITRATIEDSTALNQLINSAYRGETSKKGWTTEATILDGLRTTETELKEIIANKNNTLLKFSDKNTIIGCVLLVHNTDHLYLGMLTVAPDLQNSGIGKKLLQQAEIHALELGLQQIVMTVITVRDELIAWYMRNGYKDTGVREPFPVSDVHISITNEPLEFMVLCKTITTPKNI